MAAVKTHCAACNQRLPGASDWEPPELWVPEEGEFVGVVGMTRMGKSTWLKRWLKYLMAQEVTVYTWDPAREYSRHGLRRERTPLGPLLTQVTVSEVLAEPELLRVVEPDAELPAVAIVPNEVRPRRVDIAAGFAQAVPLILEHAPKGRVVLVVEECGLLEGNRQAEELLQEIATTWGKEDLAAAFASQATSQVPDRCRRQWRKVVAFRQVDTNDRAALTRLVSGGFSQRVARLRPHECVLADRTVAHGEALEEASAEGAG
ncbi:hypothetical protein SAMN05443639_12315 [Stigmatella erecta]|uniref:Uncharacterized protein n=1 Tax=Stigmatella erecta TaxID=83460 RepID=A0A1I0LBJ9_9BACT|nr:hypothetical protein SAMN05443639_12315 [Stigmatella erecta]